MQFDALAAVFQGPAELTRDIRPGIKFLKPLPVLANNDVSMRSHRHTRPKLEFDALGQAPARKVHSLIACVVQFDPLQIGQIIGRVIEDFVNDDLSAA